MSLDDDLTRTHADAPAAKDDWRARIDAARAQAEALPRPAARRPAVDDSTADIDPVTVPGYRLVRRISRGGQGTVYEAQRSDSQRQVAIKMLRAPSDDGGAERARFEREVKILRTLKDPRIVAIHEHGFAGARAYFVMNYIEGRPLDEYLAARPRPLRRVIELLAEICDAVDSAHALQIVHRDLKPANVLIDEEGRPYILDFGLARTIGSHGSSELTRAGEFVGSLLWASPEQLSGDPSAIDVRTDVYSLGVMLYQTLTGQFPYAVSAGVAQATESIRSIEPIRPSELHPDVPPALERIILRCLQKKPSDRYARAGLLAADLRRSLDIASDQPYRDDGWKLLPAARRREPLVIVTAARRVAESLFGYKPGQAPIVNDPATGPSSPPRRAAGAAIILLAAAQLLAGILVLALIAIAATSRHAGDWVDRGFDLLIIGAYIFFVPASLGLLLLRPLTLDPSQASSTRSNWQNWRVWALFLAVVAALVTFPLLRGRKSLIDLVIVALAIVPGAALLQMIARVLRQQGDWRRAGHAVWQTVALIAFGVSALVVLTLRRSETVTAAYPHVLYGLTAISLLAGLALGASTLFLLNSLHRLLHRNDLE